MSKYESMRLFSMQHGGVRSAAVQEELQRRLQGGGAFVFPLRVNGYNTFVALCPELLELIGSIYVKHLKLVRFSAKLRKEILYHANASAMLEEIQQSNEYEGVSSTRREIRAAMDDVGQERSDKRFFGMVRKYNMLLGSDEIPLRTSTDIRRLYDEFVLDEVVRENPKNAPDGVIFRVSQAEVVSPHEQTIHVGVSPETKVIEAMDQALSVLNDPRIDLLIRAAVFHYMFCYIHPFYDGNGRMDRFISSYVLSDIYEKSACLRMAYIIKSHRSTYERMFKEANDERSMGDLTRFVIEFLRFFEEAIDDARSTLTECGAAHSAAEYALEVVITRVNPRLKPYRFLLRRMLIITLFGHADLDVRQIALSTKSSEKRVRRALDQCGDLVKRKKDGRKYVWCIDLQALTDAAMNAMPETE